MSPLLCALHNKRLSVYWVCGCAITQARYTLYDVSTRLISSWKSSPGGGSTKDVAPAAAAADVKPKGFLGLLLDARSKASGDALTDNQV